MDQAGWMEIFIYSKKSIPAIQSANAIGEIKKEFPFRNSFSQKDIPNYSAISTPVIDM
jgi:hypothetical protein